VFAAKLYSYAAAGVVLLLSPAILTPFLVTIKSAALKAKFVSALNKLLGINVKVSPVVTLTASLSVTVLAVELFEATVEYALPV
jgi:hypothetical protein